jgi:hypothetical protein
MAAPDPRERGLDPAHILSLANQATGGGQGRAGRAVAAHGSVRVCLPSRRAAGDASAALTRVGYQVARIDGTGHRDLLVTGWSAAGLESRLAAMRAVLHQLDASPAVTAAAVVERARRLPAGSPAQPDTSVLADARAQLRGWVSGRSGIHAPHDPAIVPADRGNALRLRVAWTLEAAIDDLVERHLRVAGHALPLFRFLRPHTTDDQAAKAAIRRAGITFHLNASPAQDSSALVQRATRPPGTGPRSSAADPGGGAPARPARLAASGFPRPVTDAVRAADVTTIPSARPGGRHFPAGRPGPHR